MLYDYLFEFSVFIECGKTSGAACKLGISQSTLTRHLAALEKELGGALYERGPSGIVLTRSGRVANDAGRRLADLGSALARHFSNDDIRGSERQLTVGGVTSASGAIARLRAAGERLRLSNLQLQLQCLEPRSFASVREALASHQVDVVLSLGVESERGDGAGVASYRFGQLQATAYIPRDSPLAKRATVHLKDLAQGWFVQVRTAANNMSELWDELERVCESRGITPRCIPLGAGVVPSPQNMAADASFVYCSDMGTPTQFSSPDYVAVPVQDVHFWMSASVRSDDAVAVRLVQEAIM